MKHSISIAALLVAISPAAFATDKHDPPKTGGNTYNQGGNAVAGAAAGAAAASRSTATAGGGAGGNAAGGQGGSGAGGQGGTVNNTNNVSTGNGNGGGWNGGPGTFPASSAYAPSFALGSMCQESTSGGISVFWAGVSGGGVRTMEFCVVKMKADHFRALGNEPMARAMECGNAELRAAYKGTGQPCPADVPQQVAAAPVAAPAAPQAINTVQCFDAAGRSVALGQPGAIRCN